MPYFLEDVKKYLCLDSSYSSSYNYIKCYAKKGLLHKTKEAAIAHTEALLSFTEQKDE
jgi:hypothetical protein